MGFLNLGFFIYVPDHQNMARTQLMSHATHHLSSTTSNQIDLCSIGPLITNLEVKAMSNCGKSFWMLTFNFQYLLLQMNNKEASTSLTATLGVALVWNSWNSWSLSLCFSGYSRTKQGGWWRCVDSLLAIVSLCYLVWCWKQKIVQQGADFKSGVLRTGNEQDSRLAACYSCGLLNKHYIGSF